MRYRIKAEHPRRPGPLVVRDVSGNVLGCSGDFCDNVPPKMLQSMIANGYVEPVESPKRGGKREGV